VGNIIIGILLMVVGLFFFIAFSILLTRNFKHYKKTGELPALPNVWEESAKGWKIILGRKKNKS